MTMHRNGINLRYLGNHSVNTFLLITKGLVRRHAKADHVHRLLLTEMVARVVKHKIRYTMRNSTEYSDTAMFELITNVMTPLFSKDSLRFWNSEIYPALSRRYPGWEVSREETERIRNLKYEGVYLYSLGKRISNLGK